MAKSTAFSEINKINNARKLLVTAEKNIGLPNVKDGSSITELASNLNALPKDYYTGSFEENGWVDLEKMYLEDLNLEENGGHYRGSAYLIVDGSYDKSYFTFYDSDSGYITSDSADTSTIIKSSDVTVEHVWDTSKDLTDKFGNKYRWIKLYSYYDTGIKNVTFYDFNSYKVNTTPLGCGIQILAGVFNCDINYGSYGSGTMSNCQICIFGKQGRRESSYTTSMPCLKYAKCYHSKGDYIFTPIDGAETVIFAFDKCDDDTGRHDLGFSTLDRCKHLVLPSGLKTIALYTIPAVETLHIGTMASSSFTINPANNVKELSVGENWDSYGKFEMPQLSHNSLVGVLKNLKDLTGQSSKTLTIKKINLDKLTEEEKAIATTKNWVLN